MRVAAPKPAGLSITLALAIASGCSDPVVEPTPDAATSDVGIDSAPSDVSPAVDAVFDAIAEASRDATVDAASDVVFDIATDAATDAASDATVDTVPDVTFDATDATVDTRPDVATDSTIDVAMDVASDVRPDATDATADATPDVVEDPVARALRTGNAADAPVSGLCAAVRATIRTARERRLALWSTLYGTSATGAATATSLTDFTWAITHDSMVLDSLDEERNVPVIVANAWSAAGTAPRSVLGFAGETGAWRYIALGTNGLSDMGRAMPAAGTPAARMETLFARMVRWLSRNESPTGAGLRVITAHLADSYYFRHDAGTRAFFARNFPAATLNTDDTCESANLPACLDRADLLVIGADDGAGDDNSHVALDTAAIARALDAARTRGIPVLFAPHYRDENAMSAVVHSAMRIRVTNNYWNIETVTSGAPSDVTARPSSLDRIAAAVDTVCDGTLATSDYAECLAGASLAATTLRQCAAPLFRSKLLDGVEDARGALASLDNRAIDPFAADGYGVLRGAIALGDAFRAGASGAAALRYPIDWRSSAPTFARSVFADSTVHLTHGGNRAQTDLGTYACPRASVLSAPCMPYDPATTAVADAAVNATFLAGDEWTSTGRYALAGRPFRVRRTDSTSANVYVRVGFAREGTTRAFVTRSNGTNYDRPQYLVTPWVLVPRGADAELSSPIGGPIYMRLQGSASVVGMPAAVDTHGTARHAALLEATPAASAGFVADVQSNPLPHVDMRLTGFEIHLRRDRFLNTASGSTNIADRPSGSVTVRYDGDAARVVDHVQNHFVGPVYALAGFAAPGSTLAATLSADEQAVCTALGWACTDASIHRRSTIQHANYDEYANCGSGCSGNPFDADWSIIPLGWGESHELGHNLQIKALNVHWMPATDRNNWSRWQNRAGENSNNIFPYHTLWRYVRTVLGDTTEVRDGHMNFKTLFAASQSARAGLVSTVSGARRRVIFDEGCNVLADADPAETDLLPDAIWGDPAYAADNGLRMAFYVGLPIRLQGRMVRGRRLTDGWDIFPLLYAHARLLDSAARDATSWNTARSSLGFDRFAYDGDATYGGGNVRSIPGNDFLVVSLSFLTGLDVRPYFRDHGVRVSDLASAQVDAHITAGRVSGTLGGNAVVLETEVAPRDLSTATTVALDGTATWPRDGWHPSRCVR